MDSCSAGKHGFPFGEQRPHAIPNLAEKGFRWTFFVTYAFPAAAQKNRIRLEQPDTANILYGRCLVASVYIMPPMPPMPGAPPMPAGMSSFSLGLSATIASVVSSKAATEAAF